MFHPVMSSLNASESGQASEHSPVSTKKNNYDDVVMHFFLIQVESCDIGLMLKHFRGINDKGRRVINNLTSDTDEQQTHNQVRLFS